jgi:hypothetical protein
MGEGMPIARPEWGRQASIRGAVLGYGSGTFRGLVGALMGTLKGP